MTTLSRPSAPLALDAAYTLWHWLDSRTAGFPIADRHGVGQQLRDTCVSR